jgi:hypothetical protein
MKIRATAIALLGLSLLGLAFLPISAGASGRLQETETPPATVESCLTLPPDEQSDCFATKAAIGELQRQTQEVLGVTATAQAIEQNIQGTLQAEGATPTPQVTEALPTPTPEGFSVPVPGLNDVRLNLVSMIGLGVCAIGGIVLIVLGVYLVRGSNRDGDEEAPATAPPPGEGQMEPDVRPLVSEAVAPPMPAMPPAASAAPAPLPPAAMPVAAPPPAMETTLADHRLQGAAAPGTQAVLVSTDGHQVRVTSGDFSIGRAFENDLVVDARFSGYENVSAEHARIVQDSNQRWLVEDLGSANGTTVNGRPTSMNVVQDGWRIAFGPVEFTFRLLSSEETR